MIKIRGLSKRYNHLQVLNDLDLDIKEGETLVVLGRSGVGKSVLLKNIIGITKPDKGTVNINGTIISQLGDQELYGAVHNMGMLFQGSALFDSMTVEENTGFYLKEHGNLKEKRPYTSAEIKAKVDEALRMVDLQGTQSKMPSELSGGMKRRAALARLIVYRPTIILYDEPTTGLDPITSMQINELIVKTQKELKATSVVVTHDIISALFVGDRLALIEDGKIAHIAPPDSFLQIKDPIIEFLKRTISLDPRDLRNRFKEKL